MFTNLRKMAGIGIINKYWAMSMGNQCFTGSAYRKGFASTGVTCILVWLYNSCGDQQISVYSSTMDLDRYSSLSEPKIHQHFWILRFINSSLVSWNGVISLPTLFLIYHL